MCFLGQNIKTWSFLTQKHLKMEIDASGPYHLNMTIFISEWKCTQVPNFAARFHIYAITIRGICIKRMPSVYFEKLLKGNT